MNCLVNKAPVLIPESSVYERRLKQRKIPIIRRETPTLIPAKIPETRIGRMYEFASIVY